MAKPEPQLNLSHRLGRRLLRVLINVLGAVALLMLVLALTPLPGYALRWLSHAGPESATDPDVIVLMGGGGIPSETGLMRSYETATQARRHPKARVILAMPFEPGETNGRPGAVVRELILRGVDADRITQEGQGRHTREQALLVWNMVGGKNPPAVLVVSSPEHVRRSVLAFRKVGFPQVRGVGTHGQMLVADLSLSHGRLPNPAQTTLLRYHIWEGVIVEIRVLREVTALLYYKLQGWI